MQNYAVYHYDLFKEMKNSDTVLTDSYQENLITLLRTTNTIVLKVLGKYLEQCQVTKSYFIMKMPHAPNHSTIFTYILIKTYSFTLVQKANIGHTESMLL